MCRPCGAQPFSLTGYGRSTTSTGSCCGPRMVHAVLVTGGNVRAVHLAVVASGACSICPPPGSAKGAWRHCRHGRSNPVLLLNLGTPRTVVGVSDPVCWRRQPRMIAAVAHLRGSTRKGAKTSDSVGPRARRNRTHLYFGAQSWRWYLRIRYGLGCFESGSFARTGIGRRGAVFSALLSSQPGNIVYFVGFTQA